MLIGLDTETHRIQPGRVVPRHVCTSLAVDTPEAIRDLDLLLGDHGIEVGGPSCLTASPVDGMTWCLLDRDATAAVWPTLVTEHDLVIHNASFDMRVLAANFGHLPETFDALERGRVWCTEIRERLAALAIGQLRYRLDAFEGKTKPTATNLAQLAMRYLKIDLRDDKTDPMAWRLRYSELDGVPLTQWPEAATTYAAMDAVYALAVFRAQEERHPAECGGWPTREAHKRPVDVPRFAGEVREVCAQFMLDLGAGWGLRTDADAVKRAIAEWSEDYIRAERLGRAHGFVRTEMRKDGKGPTKKDGTVDKYVLQRMTADAFVANGIVSGAQCDCAVCGGEGTVTKSLKAGDKVVECKACFGTGQWAIGLPRTDKTREVQTGEDVLLRAGDPVLTEYAGYLQGKSWLKKYGKILRAGTVMPVTYSVKGLVSTGRTAVSKPPMQQPPRSGPFRGCFVPRAGYLYAGADYDQFELRALAQNHLWMGFDDSLAVAFREGMDPHVLMAVDILNAEGHATPEGVEGEWTYDTAIACLSGAYGPKWRKVVKTYRQMAKAANFGLPGGLGAATFQEYAAKTYGVVISSTKAFELKALWLKRWPAMGPYLARVSRQLEYTETFTVQQPVSNRVRGGCRYTDGANTYFQGLCADAFKAAGWEIQRLAWTVPDSPLFGSRMVLPLHDEYILEVPEAKAAAAAEHLAKVMRDEAQRHMPDVPVTTEPVLMRRWYKEAETVRVDGVLVPWEPEVTGG